MSETQVTKVENKKAQKKSPRKPANQFGYMYIGHLPHGFYEDEIKSYFSQFGKVCRVRLARSKITGNYKGYGFVQFESREVADIAAETMNNYLMFNKLLKCHSIPYEKLHPETFKNAKKKFFKPLQSMFRKKFNQKKTAEKLIKIGLKRSAKMKKRQEKLKSLGINLDLDQVLNSKAAEAKNKKGNAPKNEIKLGTSAAKKEISNKKEKKIEIVAEKKEILSKKKESVKDIKQVKKSEAVGEKKEMSKVNLPEKKTAKEIKTEPKKETKIVEKAKTKPVKRKNESMEEIKQLANQKKKIPTKEKKQSIKNKK